MAAGSLQELKSSRSSSSYASVAAASITSDKENYNHNVGNASSSLRKTPQVDYMKIMENPLLAKKTKDIIPKNKVSFNSTYSHNELRKSIR